MSDLFSTNPHTAGGPLTVEQLLAGIEAIKNMPPHPCSRGQHLLPARARYRPGWYVCGSCMAPVHVPIPLAER
jgi:hypothetical protein